MDFHNPVFIVSAVAVVLFVAYALVFQDQASSFFGWLRPALTSTFDAFFLWSANIFVLFCLALVVSPWGGVRLGGSEAKPDFGYVAWFAMPFAAGMGIGLMFFGVLEPVFHMAISEPLGVPSPIAAMAQSSKKTLMPPKEWGLRRPRSTGGCIHGQSMPSWRSRWRFSLITRDCH